MKNNKKYDYGKAEADLYDVGARFPEDVYEYSSEKSFRRHMKEYGLNPDRYLKSEKKNTSYGSGRSSGSSRL